MKLDALFASVVGFSDDSVRTMSDRKLSSIKNFEAGAFPNFFVSD